MTKNLKTNCFKTPSDNNLNNKLGWLLEMSNITPSFEPVFIKEPIRLVQLSIDANRKNVVLQYLQTKQTDLGRKWHVYDFPVEKIKRKLIWTQNTNRY